MHGTVQRIPHAKVLSSGNRYQSHPLPTFIVGIAILNGCAGEGNEVGDLASVQRQFQNSCVLNDCADCRAARLYLCGICLNLDRLGYLADFQRDVYRRIAVHLKHDVRLHKRAKSGQRRFQSIRTGCQVR